MFPNHQTKQLFCLTCRGQQNGIYASTGKQKLALTKMYETAQDATSFSLQQPGALVSDSPASTALTSNITVAAAVTLSGQELVNCTWRNIKLNNTKLTFGWDTGHVNVVCLHSTALSLKSDSSHVDVIWSYLFIFSSVDLLLCRLVCYRQQTQQLSLNRLSVTSNNRMICAHPWLIGQRHFTQRLSAERISVSLDWFIFNCFRIWMAQRGNDVIWWRHQRRHSIQQPVFDM